MKKTSGHPYLHLILYGASMALFLFLLKWLGVRFIIINYAFELYVGSIAILFTGFGIWLTLKLVKPKVKTVVVEREILVAADKPFELNQAVMQNLHISQRELEVLQLMAAGLSNSEIANQLHISLDTVKSHSKSLFSKMEVQRRTQAIEKARRLGLIPLGVTL